MPLMKFKHVYDVEIKDEVSLKAQQNFFTMWGNNYKSNLENGMFRSYSHINHIGNYEIRKIPFGDIGLVISTIGPSLDNHLQLLKENQNKFIHMAMDVTLPALIKNGICPNILTTIDPSNRIYHLIKDYLSYSKNIVLVCSTTTCPELLVNWKGPIIFYQQRDTMKIQNDFLTKLNDNSCTYFYGELMNAGTVIGAAIQAAIKLGFKNIGLVGHDLAFTDDKPCSIEAFPYMYNIPNEPVGSQLYKNTYEGAKNHSDFKAVDIYGKEVSSNNLFQVYANYYGMLLYNYMQFFPNTNIYNCTENGILKDINIKIETFKTWLSMFCQQEIEVLKELKYKLKFKNFGV